MTWFKVDDKLHDHRKARAAGSAAMGLWVLAGSWSADNTTDGFVPESVCQRWDRAYRKLAAALVRVDLWSPAEKDGEVGWQFHQWEERQPTRVEIEKKRAEARERMKNQRKSSPSSPDVRANSESTNAEVLVPVPSRPGPAVESGPVGGDRPVTLRAVAATEPPEDDERCTRHPNGNPRDEPCNGCKRIKERRDRRQEAAADREQRAKEARARVCRRCDGVWVLDEQERITGRKCDHRAVSA